MAKGWSMSVQRRATQQRIDSGANEARTGSELQAASKADLRASIPVYDESMVKKVPAKKPKK